MNELKWINDSKGHEAGDAAIKAVADCLMRNLGSKKRAYRMGGDEFVVTYIDMSDQEVREDISRMRSDLSEAKIVCAFGYSMISSENDLLASLKAADKQMYTDKAAIKRAVLEAGGKLHRRAGDR